VRRIKRSEEGGKKESGKRGGLKGVKKEEGESEYGGGQAKGIE
jgi:hypothetical protein